jgi:hypothetical protein
MTPCNDMEGAKIQAAALRTANDPSPNPLLRPEMSKEADNQGHYDRGECESPDHSREK